MAKEISLKELWMVVKKRLWIVIVAVVLATLLGYFYSAYFKPMPLYQSSIRILIGANTNNMSTLEVLIKDPTVLNQVSQQLNGQRSVSALENEIQVSSIDSSQVVSVSVTDSDPQLAAQIANRTAHVFKKEAASILNFTDIQLLTKAKAYPTPINPANHNKVYLGFVIGLVVGVGLIFLLNAVDDTVQSEQELKKLLESPILGSIAKMNRKNMYRRKTGRLRKGALEFSNVLKLGSKGKKQNGQKHHLVHKKSESVQQLHH